MNILQPHLEVLSEAQLALWKELSEVPNYFVLYGGTALALRLGHRKSVDFDFFSNRKFSPDELERTLSFLEGTERIQSSTDTLVSLAGPRGVVKVSFFGGLGMGRVDEPGIAEETCIRVASLPDIAATKVKVVQDRAESKDYIDIVRLLQAKVSLAVALAAAKAVYGTTFNPILSLKALCYFGDGDLAMLPEDVRSELKSAVSAVDPLNLPVVKALPGGLISRGDK